MADIEDMTPGQVLADTNIAVYIERLGLGIAEAQRALDMNSLETAVAMATERPEFSDKSLLQLGFSPTFYHYQYADLEVSLQITLRVERSTSVRVGLNASYGYSSGSGSETTGEAYIDVRYGSGSPARAKVRLSQAGPGSIKVGETTVNLETGEDVAAPNVKIVPKSIRGTANRIAERMRETEPSDSVPEVIRALVDLVPGGTPIRATTDDEDAFHIEPNKIRVLSSPDLPARAWVSVNGPGTLILAGSNDTDPDYVAANYSDSPSAAKAAVEAINGEANGYSAVLLFENRRSLRNPHFAFDKHDVLETPDERKAIEEWVEFLNEFPGQTVNIIGHADQSGRETRNDPLSLDRAEWIKQQLIDLGIDESRIKKVEGKGEREPVEDRGDAAHAPNRRVELELAGTNPPENVIRIETDARGESVTWASGRPGFADPSQGEILRASPGEDEVAITAAKYLKVKDHYLYAGSLPPSAQSPNSTWTPAADAEGTASALARAISDNAQVEAYAEGRVVHLLPEGSHAIITLESAERSAAANSLSLEVTGPSLSRESGFSGGADAGEARDGNTITLGSTVLTCRTGTPGANEFARGEDAAGTATNLAQAINRISGFTANASGTRVNITGPAGTNLATNNPGAFQLSAAQIPRPAPEVNRETSNHAVAVGLTLDVAHQRRFGLEATGNSRIAARLVSVPAPVELLDELRAWLGGNPTFPQPSNPAPTPDPTPTN